MKLFKDEMTNIKIIVSETGSIVNPLYQQLENIEVNTYETIAWEAESL